MGTVGRTDMFCYGRGRGEAGRGEEGKHFFTVDCCVNKLEKTSSHGTSLSLSLFSSLLTTD